MGCGLNRMLCSDPGRGRRNLRGRCLGGHERFWREGMLHHAGAGLRRVPGVPIGVSRVPGA